MKMLDPERWEEKDPMGLWGRENTSQGTLGTILSVFFQCIYKTTLNSERICQNEGGLVWRSLCFALHVACILYFWDGEETLLTWVTEACGQGPVKGQGGFPIVFYCPASSCRSPQLTEIRQRFCLSASRLDSDSALLPALFTHSPTLP